ncbi:MAG: hypothetical protein ABUT39_20290, partial [Acidobacteriota bacterium]
MRDLRFAACLAAAAVLLGGCSANDKVFQPPYCPTGAPTPPPAAGSGSGPLHQKAVVYDRFFQETLRPQPHGGLVNVIFPAGTTSNPVGYDDQQDSTIWTGTYLAAEAFRYAVATDPAEKQEALANARTAVKTLDLFLRVTGDPGLLARFAGPMDQTALYLAGQSPCSTLAPPAKDHAGQDPTKPVDPAGLCCPANSCFPSADQRLFWLGGTSRDQYTGWFFGMGISYSLIDDPEMRATIQADIGTVVGALRERHWKIDAPDQGRTSGDVEPFDQLTWLLLAADAGDSEACGWYEQRVREVWPLLETSLAEDFDRTSRYMQYYSFNLTFLSAYNLIRLEPNPSRRQYYLDSLMKYTYRSVERSDNAFFDYVAMAVGGQVPSGTTAKDHDALAFFAPQPTPAACVTPPPSPLSKVSLDLHRLDKKIQPEAEKPYPISQWCQQDFLWQQSPYAICCCPPAQGQSWPPEDLHVTCTSSVSPAGQDKYFPRADYLLAYWMGR